jgi:hypothetical protein
VNDRASVISYNIRSESRGCKDVYWKPVEKWVMGDKGVRESIPRDWTDQRKAHPY